ncbi:MAG: DNA cytosine methyltransferase [Candidatus Sulfotelmatobacter sp.]
MSSTDLPLAIDLFCGCGGISAGLRDAGFRVIAGADIEPNYICTFRHNFPHAQAITDNLTLVDPHQLMKRMDIQPGQLDILAGGPPCQGFSKNVPRKNRFLDLPNNRLVLTFIKYVEALQPNLVLMENVAEMKNGFEQSYTHEIVTRLEGDGYRVSYEVLNAADYGVPQRRRRAFFIARKERSLHFPPPTHIKPNADAPSLFGLEDWQHVTVWNAIGDLPSISHDDPRKTFPYSCAPFSEYQRNMRRGLNVVSNHTPRPLATTQYERLASLDPGQGIKDLPSHLRPKSGYSGAYGRLTKDMVAPTITRWVFHPGSGRFGHPEDIRVITIREAARLQGFADDFEFTGTYTQQAGQVGNAVPPLLIQQIAIAMLRQAGYVGGNGLSAAASKSMNASSFSRSDSEGRRNATL